MGKSVRAGTLTREYMMSFSILLVLLLSVVSAHSNRWRSNHWHSNNWRQGWCITGKKVPKSMITCTASSTHHGGWSCERAFDGILDKGVLFGPGGRPTAWATQDKGKGEWIQINFATPVTIKEIKLLQRVHWAGQIKEIDYLFDDKKVHKSFLKSGSMEFTVISLPKAVETKTLRIIIAEVKKGHETGGHDFGFKEIEIIGCFKEALELEDGRKFFCQSNASGKNWKDADQHCRSHGLALPIVKDIPTMKKIAKHCNIIHTFWADAKRDQGRFHYSWSTGIVIDNEDPIWHKHNPSYDGLCLEYHKGGAINDWALNDVACQTKRSVVCEQRSTEVLELEDGRKFFCQSKAGGKNWKDADQHCRVNGLVLPIVKDIPTMKKIAKHCNIKGTGDGVWVDARRDHLSLHYTWSTGHVIDNEDPIWHEHNPSYDGLCLEYQKGGAINDWALNDLACQTKRSVVCEQRSTAVTSTTITTTTTTTYSTATSTTITTTTTITPILELEDGKKLFCHSDEKNRIDAFLHCRAQGMALPIVKDIPTAKKIANHCNIKNHGQGFWVDAKKEVLGNNFKWSTGEVIDKDDPIWHKHNPSYDGLCVEFHKGGAINDWALNDVACQKMRSVVCEQRSTAVTTTTVTTTTTKTSSTAISTTTATTTTPNCACPTTLEMEDGRNFFCPSRAREMNRKDADLHCRALGLTLPIVEDKALAKKIVDHCHIKFAFWVDAMNEDQTYRWGNGSVIEDHDPNWMYTNPSYDGKCVEYRWIFKWALNDIPCYKKRVVVCEQKPW